MIERLIAFARQASGAQSALFFWAGPDCEIVAPQSLNLRENLIQRYNESIGRRDPLHMSRLKAQRREVVVLSHEQQHCPAAFAEYRAYLNSVDIGDEVDLLFWRGKEPFACLTLIRAVDQGRFTLNAFDWGSLRDFVQSSLSLHWRMRSINVAETLTHEYRLSPRELEVVRYLLLGKSNAQIAEILGIRMQTVKTHIVHILNKLGVESRLGVACRVRDLEGSGSRGQ